MVRSLSQIFSLVILFTAGVRAASLEEAGRLYFSGKSQQALDMYRELWKQEKFPEAVLNAAFIASELGATQETTRLLEEGAQADLSDSSVPLALAWHHANLGDWEKTTELISSAKLSPGEELMATLLRIRRALHEGDDRRARALLDHLTEKHPRFTLGHYYSGKLFEATGEPQSAVASFERVLKEDSHFVEVRTHLARLFEGREQMDDAWRQYARMSAADDRNAKARQGMQKLAGLITKRPEEIVPPRQISSHTITVPVADRDKYPKIRVGIGTNSGGGPITKTSLVFRTSQPFVFWDPETIKELKPGTAIATWKIRLDSRKGVAEIINPEGQSIGRFSRTVFIRQKSGDHPMTTILNSLSFAPNTSWGGMADKEIRGDVEIRLSRSRKSLVIVNHLSIEEYLYGVLAAEMPVHWPMEALKGQAVIARTQGLYRRGLHRKHGYDVCDEQHCQVYTGLRVESERVHEAVDGTRGEYLSYQGGKAHTVFSSNCGGITQTGAQAGWGDVAYWRSIWDGADASGRPESLAALRNWLVEAPEVFCRSSKYTWHPEFRWSRMVMADDLAAKISRKKKIGRIKSIRILERNGSGRVRRIRIVGTKGEVILAKEHEIRKYMGLGSIRSTLFVLDTVYKGVDPDSFILFGGGWGHGVGFCQSGAAGRADAGESYQDILKNYFPGTALNKL